jgi:hypothetical protein
MESLNYVANLAMELSLFLEAYKNRNSNSYPTEHQIHLFIMGWMSDNSIQFEKKS